MNKIDTYRMTLLAQAEWDTYLMANSGLPGPRANLELAWAAAQAGEAARFEAWLDNPPKLAPENTPQVFLVVCAALGLGEELAAGKIQRLVDLRRLANDPRWRVREATAMALQRWGLADLPALLKTMQVWIEGSLLEQRTAIAALCEPALLADPAHAHSVLDILNQVTGGLVRSSDRRAEAFRVLRKGLAYCWSVAIVANPEYGKPLFESWLASPDPDVRWILRQNLQKARLQRLDAAWVAACLAALVRESPA